MLCKKRVSLYIIWIHAAFLKVLERLHIDRIISGSYFRVEHSRTLLVPVPLVDLRGPHGEEGGHAADLGRRPEGVPLELMSEYGLLEGSQLGLLLLFLNFLRLHRHWIRLIFGLWIVFLKLHAMVGGLLFFDHVMMHTFRVALYAAARVRRPLALFSRTFREKRLING